MRLAHAEVDAERYRTLNQARWERSVRAWCVGLGLDPLMLAGEILAVVVFDADVYDRVFAGVAGHNSEGALTGTDPDRPEAGIAFTSDNVSRLLTGDVVRVLVTGAFGYVGRAVTRALLDADHHVVAMTTQLQRRRAR